MDTMDVANTILEQLGGRKFIAMTGARHFVGSPTGVSFRLPSRGFCKNSINLVRIALMPSDTYTVTFLCMQNIGGLKIKFTEISKHEDVYFDMLQELFTRETGLAVSL